MEYKDYEIDKKKIQKLKFMVIDEERENVKTGTRSNPDMVTRIQQIIIEEVQKKM